MEVINTVYITQACSRLIDRATGGGDKRILHCSDFYSTSSSRCCSLGGSRNNMSGTEEVKDQVEVVMEDSEKSMPSTQQEEEAVKKKYGGIMPKKPPLISKDHERAYFDSADWALGKQGVEKPKGPLEALRPKLQPTQQQTRYRKSPYAPSAGEDGSSAPSEEATTNE